MSPAPIVDASKFDDREAPRARKEQTGQLLDSLIEHGYVRIVNHGISSAIIHECFELSKRFFQLPKEQKDGILNVPGPSPQRGYSRLGAEKTSTLYGKMMGREVAEDLKDAREHFDQGSEDDGAYPNRWPSEDDFPGFKDFMIQFYRSCEDVSLKILAALEEALQLPNGAFQDRCRERNASELRLNHYPSISLEEMRTGRINRIWPHFDLGVITLLFVKGPGGLEFQDRTVKGAEEFVPVIPGSQDEMIVNISETMQRWTHDRLPAGLHRVTVPQEMESQTDGILPERFSIAYLCKATHSASVGPLPQFISGSDPKYEDMTALEYHQKRLLTAY